MHSYGAVVVSVALFAAGAGRAQDWTNMGGNAGRNGLVPLQGPAAAGDDRWSGIARSSIIAWHPVTLGDRVFTVRQTGFPPEPNSDLSPVVALDLATGQELWARNIPFETGDWTTWVAGARDGRVYACRGGNGASSSAPMYALDAANGSIVWYSADQLDAGAYDGVVFTDNGDLIVASFRTIKRVRAVDGTTAWTASRVGSVSGNCGAAVHGDAVYVADAVAGGHSIKRYNLNTGMFQYAGPVMAGFTLQNTPMVSPDGTIYLCRAQNNAAVDFFYAINDSGAALTIRWSVPCHWSTESEFAVGNDGSVYMFRPGRILSRLNAQTGAVLSAFASPIEADFLQPRMAVGIDGRVYVSNGAFSNGRLYSFDEDLSLRWSIPVQNINIGGPSIAHDGTLVVAGIGTNVFALRTAGPECAADFDGDGFVTGLDFDAFVASFEAGEERADFDADGFVTGLDFDAYVAAFEEGC